MTRRSAPIAALALAALALPATAQEGMSPEETRLLLEQYTQPEPVIADAVLAPRWQNVSLSNLDPTGSWFVHEVSDGPPSLASFARPHLNLGALQIDPAADRHRRLSTRSDVGLQLVSARDGSRVDVEIPNGARVSAPTWSPDGRHLAFMAHFDDGTHVYVADLDGDARRVTDDPILAVHVTDLAWTSNGREIVTVLPPADRGAMPREPAVPTTPMVRMTTDVENRLRTYFDLLENPYEIELVEYFTRGQLATIDVGNGDVTRIGSPALITDVDASPDGRLFRVESFQGEFSYIVPTTSSASKEELWDRDGTVIELLEENEAREGAANTDDDEEEEGAPEKRGLTWHADGGVVFLQMEPEADDEEAADAATDAADAADDSDAEEAPEARSGRRMDRVIRWTAPWGEDDVEVIYATPRRISSFAFDAEGGLLFLTRGSGGGWTGGGNQTVHAVDLSAPDEEYLVMEREADMALTEQPGSPMYMQGPAGTRVVHTSSDGRHVFLDGTQYFENPEVDAPRPFVDRVEIRTGETARVFQSSPEVYEQMRAPLDRDLNAVVITRESPTEVTQGYRVEMASGSETRLTENVDHTPAITSAHRESFMIARPDGFTSKVNVTMPVGWEPGDPAPPAMFWFYPSEYEDQESYDERSLARFNRNDFPNLGTRSMEILTLSGYAVVDPDLPIVGDSDQPNDRFLLDLRNTLSSVIDSLDAKELADRARLGLGGHSYGAFGTANAMVHTPFFKAGIAGDGNYNRSLTPAGFQREPRQLWEAEQIYIEMSPFFVADRLTGSLLMYHGMDDHNVGTHPDHSRRLFHALNVLGKDAALYMYPFEDHGPATRETLLDLWARWTAWLDLHVKGETQRAITFEEDGAGGS